MPGIPHTHLDRLIQHVQAAGTTLLSYWPAKSGTASTLQVEVKGDGTPVSEADLCSNDVLLNALADLFPQDPVLSEEGGSTISELQRASRVWIIDPLDGTKSFIAGRDDFSILVALSEECRPTVGVMLFPALGIIAVANHGGVATLNGRPLGVSPAQVCSPGRVYIRNFDSKRPELASEPMDSGLALLKIANGELEGAVIKMTTHRQWDIAAPAAVIEAAGGRVTDESGNPLRFGVSEFTCTHVLASNGLVHEELKALVRY